MGHSCALQAYLDSFGAFIHQGRASAGEQARHSESRLHGGALHPSGRCAFLSRQDCELLFRLSVKLSLYSQPATQHESLCSFPGPFSQSQSWFQQRQNFP